MDKYKMDVCAVQEIRWPGKGTVIKKNFMNLYSGHKSDKRELPTGLCIYAHNVHNLLDIAPVNERICKIRVLHKYYNLTLISHTPTEEKMK
jgi:hypothetical protein